MGDKPTTRQFVCYQGHCFPPPKDLGPGLARGLDRNRDGVITDQAGIGHHGTQPIEMGDSDIILEPSGPHAYYYKRLIFDEYYHRLPPPLQRNLQVWVEGVYAIRLQEPLEQIRARVTGSLTKAKTRVEEVLGEKVPEEEWLAIPVRVRSRRTKSEERLGGFAKTDPECRRVEINLFVEGDGNMTHELMHAILQERAMRKGIELVTGTSRYPNWFCEGIAHFAESRFFSLVERRFGIAEQEVMTQDGFVNFTYDNGHDSREIIDRAEAFLAVKYLVQRYGLARFQALLKKMTTTDQLFTESFEEAIETPFGNFLAEANRWVGRQLRYATIPRGEGYDTELWVEGRLIGRKNHRGDKVVGSEKIEYDEGGGVKSREVRDASGYLVLREEFEKGELTTLIRGHPGGAVESLFRRESYVTQWLRDEEERTWVITDYEGVKRLDNLSPGRVHQRTFYLLPNRPTPPEGISLLWHRLEDYEYQGQMTIRRRIIRVEPEPDRGYFALSDIRVTAGDLVVDLEFYHQPLRWAEVLHKTEGEESSLNRERLQGGRLFSLTVYQGGRIIFDEYYDERDCTKSKGRFPVKDSDHRVTVEHGPASRTVTIRSDGGKPLLEVICTPQACRLARAED